IFTIDLVERTIAPALIRTRVSQPVLWLRGRFQQALIGNLPPQSSNRAEEQYQLHFLTSGRRWSDAKNAIRSSNSASLSFPLYDGMIESRLIPKSLRSLRCTIWRPLSKSKSCTA